MNKNDDPQAFPSVARGPGMALRDYFAAAAMSGMAGEDFMDKDGKRLKPEGYAFVAYQLADAMMAQREGA